MKVAENVSGNLASLPNGTFCCKFIQNKKHILERMPKEFECHIDRIFQTQKRGALTFAFYKTFALRYSHKFCEKDLSNRAERHNLQLFRENI